jgi:L-lactate dehydrogenase complex protein LldG
MSARERIFAKLRAAAPASPPDRPDVAGYYAGYDAGRALPPPAQRVDELTAQLRAAHAEVQLVGNDDWPRVAAGILAARGVRRLLHEPGEPMALKLAACLPEGSEAVPFSAPLETWKADLFTSIDAGFSVADAGIAATGTLVFSAAPGRPRCISLVPPLHLVLLRAASIHADLYAAATAEAWSAAMPSNLILVSGPSKTSDIQQTVAYGAHGPRELIVLILQQDALPGAAR